MPGSALSDPITIRVPADVLADIERVAAETERSRSWVMVRAMRAYLAAEGRDVLAAAEGRAEIRSGRGLGVEDVLDEASKDAAA